MRKKSVLTAVICCALAALFLTGCRNGEPENNAVETLDTIYEEHDVRDRDDGGNLILTSSEYRQVYLIDAGTYLVLVLGDTGPSSITVVKDFGTSDAAVEYVTGSGQALVESGEYSNLNIDGKYVTYSPTLTSEKYGKYYRMSKAEVEESLSSYVKQ